MSRRRRKILSSLKIKTLYWIGGTGNTNSATHYSLTSGGSAASLLPDGNTNVIWDGNSGGGTCTINAAFACRNFDASAYTGTIAGSSALNIGGSFILGASMTRTFTSITTLSSTSQGNTITLNGKTTGGSFTFNGLGGGWIVQDNWISTSSITVAAGDVNWNGKTINCTPMTISGSSPRSMTGGACTINCTNFNITGATNLSMSMASATINTSGTTVSLGNYTYGLVKVTAQSASLSGTTGLTIGTLQFMNASGYTRMFVTAPDITILTALTFQGADAGVNRLTVLGTQGAPTVFNLGSIIPTITNTDLRDITLSGANAPYSGTSVGQLPGCTGITFSAPRDCYYIAPAPASGNFLSTNYATSSGGSPVTWPLPQDTAFGDDTGIPAGKTILSSAVINVPNVDFSACTRNAVWSTVPGGNSWYGSVFKLGSNMSTLGSVGTSGFAGRVPSTLTTNGVSFAFPLSLNNIGSSTTLADDFTSTASGGISLSTGSLIDGGHTVTLPSINISSGTGTKSIVKTGNWIINGVGGFLTSSGATGLTVSDTAGYIKLTDNSSTDKPFNGAGFTYHDFWNATAGTGRVVLTGSNTFNDFKTDTGRTTRFTAGTTTTAATFTIGNNAVFNSPTGAAYSLVSSSGTAVNMVGANISNCNASGAVFTVIGGTDGGGNTGIVFSPIITTNLQLWLDGNDPAGTGILPADATSIASWKDKSGNARHADQASASAQPTYYAEALNGLGMMQFYNGLAQHCDTPAFDITAGTGNYTLYHVVIPTDITTLQILDISTVPSPIREVFADSDSNNVRMGMFDGVGLNGFLQQPAVFNTPHVTAYRYNNSGNASKMWCDTQTPVTGAAAVSASSSVGRRIGGHPVAATWFMGLVGEILIYSGAQSDADVATTIAYLGTRWGVTVS